YRVRCFYKGPSASNLSEFTGDCPQSPQTGMYGGHAFDPPGNQGPWPTATGAMFEIWIPVKSSRQLNGSVPSSGPCDTCLYAGVWMIDGVNSPWVWPRIPVYVGGSSTTSGPYVTYPAPAITDVTYNPSDNAAYVKLWANLFTEGTSGKAYFQMGFKKGEYVAKSNPEITVPSGSWQMSEIWRMQPGKIYHWRACYEPTGGTRVCGPNKSFHAPPDTVITESKIRRSKRRATFSFTSPTSGMIFQCKLDDQKWKACTSPRAYGKLSKGTHVFRVRAVDPVGNKDTTPAKKAFRI
ncbi:MAG TPA: hypothetical protein VM638_06265, partial [Actinomycetota bacterium]|nr:hypothetical protein [Actinomycetota bacterium]